MQNFVRDRSGGAASPQNGQPFSRIQLAAKAKVKPGDALGYQAQQNKSTRLYSRGEHRSARTQPEPQQPQHKPFYQQDRDHDHDAYGTDAESIDTTIDHSTVKAEDVETNEYRNLEVVGPESNSEEDDDDAENDDDYDEEGDESHYEPEEEGADNSMYQHMSDNHIVTIHGLQHESDALQADFLQQLRTPQIQDFALVDGDSYPSTTDGEPTEWNGRQPPFPETSNHDAPITTSYQQPQTKQAVSQFPTQQPDHRGTPPKTVFVGRTVPDPKNIFKDSANIRERQRNETDMKAREDANRLPDYGPAASDSRQNPIQVNVLPERGSRQPPQVPQVVTPVFRVTDSNKPLNPFVSAPIHTKFVGNGHQAEEKIVEEQSTTSICDYDREELLGMSYDKLKGESFDKDPRAEPSVLSDDMISKPLAERLEFVRKNLDGARQSTFFNSLPTTEWEDAGDWFLDRFSSIIQKSREARRKKRKLAHEFEEEVEDRHQHVSKKQQQVEDAMAKMKTQGEGLVPRSPRVPKTPRTRKA